MLIQQQPSINLEVAPDPPSVASATVNRGFVADLIASTNPVPLDFLYDDTSPGFYALNANDITILTRGVYLATVHFQGSVPPGFVAANLNINGNRILEATVSVSAGLLPRGLADTRAFILNPADVVTLEFQAVPGAILEGSATAAQRGSKIGLSFLGAA